MFYRCSICRVDRRRKLFLIRRFKPSSATRLNKRVQGTEIFKMYKLSSKSGKTHQRQKKGQIWAFMLVLLLASCKTIEYVPVEHTDSVFITQYATRVKYDSIYIDRDTRVVRDTTYITTTQIKYKYLQNTDTIYKEKVEIKEVPVEVEVVKEVKQKTPFFVYALIFFGGGLCSIALLGKD